MGDQKPTADEARRRVFDEWREELFNGNGTPPSVVAPHDGSDAPPDLKRANLALREWGEYTRQLYSDAYELACEVDRLRKRDATDVVDDEAAVVAWLRADPQRAASVLAAAKIAVVVDLAVVPAGVLAIGHFGVLQVYVLGRIECPPGESWGWWIAHRVDPDQPSGVADGAEDAMNQLVAALEARGWVVARKRPEVAGG